MVVSASLLFELGVILIALTVLGGAARRIGLSPIPLYLLAGLAVGEGGFTPIPAAGEFVRVGASIGLVLLLLTLGLEFSITEFATSLRRHLPSAWVDLVLNATPGAIAGWLLGLDVVGILALAGVTYISSSGLIARLLSDLRRLGNRETPAVLSVLVLEDFAMAAYLPLLTVLAAGGTWWQAGIGISVAVTALMVAFIVSYHWGHHVGRLVTHPDNEQLLLRIMGFTLIVAALAEFVHASAAVGAFVVGLALTGESAERARVVLSPLRDLFAAIFFLAIGYSVDPADLMPMLPAALAIAVVTALTKVLTGQFAARRDGVARPGRLRAGTALIARGEFSLVIIGLVGASIPQVSAVATPYVFVLALVGPVLTRFSGRGRRRKGQAPRRTAS
ncbi:cation:proton antiporter [Mycobacterium sp. IS-3022]|uniref:cation:proton antiporter n=1 Tax=Mycobacterium sp. IS-3022 TaxID=1772277 RepID=UPI00074174B0|nr:cation:proton antiporter [Mycobacterium sp. IS-3022]KUH93244.1 potassium transporter [Mycobacterium sp. IS-3022]